MEFYNRMKQKLAEELEADEQPPEYPQGNGFQDVESLKQEIEELKHHLNTNYTVYSRRLDKRKNKIKDLEACLRNVTSENEKLAREAEQAESYRIKLEEYREQLEQLESYQSQELAKVKHMLLNAEAALQDEKRRNKADDEETVSNSETVDRNGVDMPEHLPDFHLQQKISELGRELSRERQSKSSLQVRIDSLEGEMKDLQSKLLMAVNEKDSLRNSLLEIEIASHEGDNLKAGELDTLKIEIAKLQAEKETLNVTLSIRENEIRTKKDEIKQEKENHEEANKTIDAKNVRISMLEAELESFKNSLNERSVQLHEVQKVNDKLQAQVENQVDQLQHHENAIAKVRRDNENLTRHFDSLSAENSRLLSVIDALKSEQDTLRNELDTMAGSTQKYSEDIEKLSSEYNSSLLHNRDLEDALRCLEASIPGQIESSDLVASLRAQVKSLEDDLEEKKQAVRHLQLRSAEMKKMLQREMKSNSDNTNSQPSNGQASCTPPPPRGLTPIFSGISGEPFFDHSNEVVAEETLKYLRHVIFKFLTSPEVEAKQMVRALATILQFSGEEEKTLQDYLDWKMSWFGSKPKLPA